MKKKKMALIAGVLTVLVIAAPAISALAATTTEYNYYTGVNKKYSDLLDPSGTKTIVYETHSYPLLRVMLMVLGFPLGYVTTKKQQQYSVTL